MNFFIGQANLLSFIDFYLMLQDKSYNKEDEIIKATSFEVISTLRDVLKTSSLWRDHVQTYSKVYTLDPSVFVFIETWE